MGSLKRSSAQSYPLHWNVKGNLIANLILFSLGQISHLFSLWFLLFFLFFLRFLFFPFFATFGIRRRLRITVISIKKKRKLKAILILLVNPFLKFDQVLYIRPDDCLRCKTISHPHNVDFHLHTVYKIPEHSLSINIAYSNSNNLNLVCVGFIG